MQLISELARLIGSERTVINPNQLKQTGALNM